MKKPEGPGRTGRPKIQINWEEFEKLCSLHCTLVEIAEWFKCSEDTIERAVQREYKTTFAEIYKKKSSRGKVSLRRRQYEIALSGNVTMLIWLGKQCLDQKDKHDVQPIILPQPQSQHEIRPPSNEELIRLYKLAKNEPGTT